MAVVCIDVSAVEGRLVPAWLNLFQEYEAMLRDESDRLLSRAHGQATYVDVLVNGKREAIEARRFISAHTFIWSGHLHTPEEMVARLRLFVRDVHAENADPVGDHDLAGALARRAMLESIAIILGGKIETRRLEFRNGV